LEEQMTTATKTIESLGLSDKDARNALEVTYKKNHYVFYTDEAGLDYFDFNKDQSAGHELFCAIVDNYGSLGLLKALMQAGAVIKPAKKSRGYFLYKIQGHKELWKGAIEKEHSYRAGYVFEMANLDQAIDAAEEEMRCMMAEAF
jgi:hypothetical protein